MTGVNTIRIYNPVLNSVKHDPDAAFIKKWVPELAALDPAIAHEPWKAPLLVASTGYPTPVTSPEEGARAARQAYWGFRKEVSVQEENRRILKKHVRHPRTKS